MGWVLYCKRIYIVIVICLYMQCSIQNDKRRGPCGPYSVEKRGQHIKLWANTKKAPPNPRKARQIIKIKMTAGLPVLKLWQPHFRHLAQIWTWALDTTGEAG